LKWQSIRGRVTFEDALIFGVALGLSALLWVVGWLLLLRSGKREH
jgi:hypothetical protein